MWKFKIVEFLQAQHILSYLLCHSLKDSLNGSTFARVQFQQGTELSGSTDGMKTYTVFVLPPATDYCKTPLTVRCFLMSGIRKQRKMCILDSVKCCKHHQWWYHKIPAERAIFGWSNDTHPHSLEGGETKGYGVFPPHLCWRIEMFSKSLDFHIWS